MSSHLFPPPLITAAESCTQFTPVFVSPANIFLHLTANLPQRDTEQKRLLFRDAAFHSFVLRGCSEQPLQTRLPPFFYISPCCLETDSEALSEHRTHSFPLTLLSSLLIAALF